jgi:hypothetical protein
VHRGGGPDRPGSPGERHAKAKEWIGNRDRPGRTWRPGKSPVKVDCHTFVTNDQPVVIPYGIYDIATNTGWVNVGTDHWNYTVASCAPHPPEQAPTRRKSDPALTEMLTDSALTGMTRADFAHLVAVSEPYWDALAEAAFQRRFHRPRGYLHPQTSSVDHFQRLLTALLRRRRAVTSTLLAKLLGVTRTNLSNQFRDGHRILDLHRIDVSPMPGSPACTLDQLRARLTPAGLVTPIMPPSSHATRDQIRQ